MNDNCFVAGPWYGASLHRTGWESFIRYQRRTYPYYDQRNQDRLPAYHRLDFAWNIEKI